MRFPVVLLNVALLLAAGPVRSAPAGEEWWDPVFPHRLSLTFPASPVELRDLPVLLTGREFYALTGAPRPPCASFRAVTADGERPLQVDERDGTGEIVAQPNGVLDGDDEILFTVHLAAGQPTPCFLYWADTSQPPPLAAAAVQMEPESRDPSAAADGTSAPRRPAAVQVEPESDDPFVRLWLSNDRLRLGFNSRGTDTPEKNEPGNWGRGTIAKLFLDGFPLTNIGGSWTFFLPHHPFGAGPGDFRWSDPEVVAAGPVRTVLRMRRTGIEWKSAGPLTALGGQVFLTGEATHTFALYAAAPIVDAEMTLRYTATRDDWPAAFNFPLQVGKSLDPADVLLVPLAGQVFRRAVTQDDLDGWYPTLYSTPVPEEGWFAWVDSQEHVGLAVFYERMASLRDRAEWVSYRPVLNPEVHVRLTPGGSVENTVQWVHRSLTSATVMRYPLRLVGLTDDHGDAVRWQYRLWAEELRRVAAAGFPESR
jgi:hypothetical protein